VEITFDLFKNNRLPQIVEANDNTTEKLKTLFVIT
jgi:hypothetical protein